MPCGIAAAQLELSTADRTKAKLEAAIFVQKDLPSATDLPVIKVSTDIVLTHHINTVLGNVISSINNIKSIRAFNYSITQSNIKISCKNTKIK